MASVHTFENVVDMISFAASKNIVAQLGNITVCKDGILSFINNIGSHPCHVFYILSDFDQDAAIFEIASLLLYEFMKVDQIVAERDLQNTPSTV